MQWALYGLWGRGKGIWATFFMMCLIDMCAGEGCSHNRQWHKDNGKCTVQNCQCPKYHQNEIYSNWGIYKDVQKNHDFKDVESFLPHCHPLRLDEFLEFENVEEYARKVGIDEPYAWGLDSRDSGSYYGKKSTSQGFQHRKTVGDMLFTTQLPSRLDKSMRGTSDDFLFAVKPDDWGFHYVWFGNTSSMQHLERSYVMKSVWPHYNHKEKIEPHFLDEYDQDTLTEGWTHDELMVQKAIETMQNHLVIDEQGIRNVKTP